MFFLCFRTQKMASFHYDIVTSLFDSENQTDSDLMLAVIFIVIAVVIEILLALLLTKRIHEYLHLRVVYKRNLRLYTTRS